MYLDAPYFIVLLCLMSGGVTFQEENATTQ